jgi:hypothetical protein
MEITQPQIEAIGNWLLHEDTGCSSMVIAGVLLGGKLPEQAHFCDPPVPSPYHPCDIDDFSRCFTLVKMIPDGDALFKEKMRYASKEWYKIVDRWDELCALWVEERDNRNRTAPKLYSLMLALEL